MQTQHLTEEKTHTNKRKSIIFSLPICLHIICIEWKFHEQIVFSVFHFVIPYSKLETGCKCKKSKKIKNEIISYRIQNVFFFALTASLQTMSIVIHIATSEKIGINRRIKSEKCVVDCFSVLWKGCDSVSLSIKFKCNTFFNHHKKQKKARRKK